MLVFGLMLLAVTARSAYGNEECSLREKEECSNLTLVPQKFPDTQSKLRNTCNDITGYLGCAVNVKEDCDPHSNETKSLRHAYESFQILCNEDNPTYQDLSKNIHCIAENVPPVPLYCLAAYVMGEEGFFRQTVSKHVEDFDSLTKTDLDCAHSIHVLTCVSTAIGIPCENGVEELIYNIGANFDKRSQICSPEMQALKEPLRADFRLPISDLVNEHRDSFNSIIISNN